MVAGSMIIDRPSPAVTAAGKLLDPFPEAVFS
jgi:hypothetical protein